MKVFPQATGYYTKYEINYLILCRMSNYIRLERRRENIPAKTLCSVFSMTSKRTDWAYSVECTQFPSRSFSCRRTMLVFTRVCVCVCVFREEIFNSVFLLSSKSQISLRGLYNLYTYDIPVPGPHGSGITTPEKKLSQEKKGRNLQESNRRGSLSPDGQKQKVSRVQKEHFDIVST